MSGEAIKEYVELACETGAGRTYKFRVSIMPCASVCRNPCNYFKKASFYEYFRCYSVDIR